MLYLEPLQDPGPVQKIVNEGVDGDHAAADLDPGPSVIRSTEQDAGQGHGEDLVRDAVDLAQGLDQGGSQPSQPASARWTVRGLQLSVDLADQIPVGNVANKQK